MILPLTLDAPTPTNISTKSEPDIKKKGTPASPAQALLKIKNKLISQISFLSQTYFS